MRNTAKRFRPHLHHHIGRHLSRRQHIQLTSASLVLLVVAVGSFVAINHQLAYLMSPQSKSLLSKSSVDLKKIKVTEQGYSFNKQKADSADALKKLTVAGTADSSGKLPFQAELPKAAKEGISFKDQSGELAVKLIPQFNSSSGKLTDDGHVVYPASRNEQHVYTFKRNGLKEDILLTKSPGDTATYSWQLETNDRLETKLLPNGAVGFYSTNPMLYGDITASNPSDQSLVEKARKNGKKDHLAFIIPKAFIKDAGGVEHYEGVKFELKNNLLTLTAKGLDKQDYPLSIDPSIAVTTTNDFQGGSDDGMIDYSDSDQISRGSISTGAVGSTTQQAGALVNARTQTAVAAYKGYLYVVAGQSANSATGCDATGYCSDIMYCPINADGSIGTCTQQLSAATGFTGNRKGHTVNAYNGYLYIAGGGGNSGSFDDIQRCSLNTDGSVNTCTQQTGAFNTARSLHNSAINNGYFYIIGGNFMNDIQYCPINANGSVGTCTLQNNAFTNIRSGQTAGIYNNFMYIIGGGNGGGYNDIQYCPINANGSVGTCVQQTSAFTTGRSYHTTIFANGYLYIIGGYDGVSADLNDIQYCPINANGSVGTCVQQTSAFTTARSSHASTVYNGFIYIVGGSNGTKQSDVQRLPITFNGPASAAIQQTSAFTTARRYHSSVLYEGYLYIIGGGPGYYSDIQRCPINADGSVGSCTQQTSAFTSGRQEHSTILYDGYIYIIGGDATGVLQNDIQRCPINASTHVVGACTQQTAAFTTARKGQSSVYYAGYLYIVGGYDGTATRLSDIQRCPINASTHVVGACTQQTAAFTTGRANHTSVVYNGNLYIIGGTNGAQQNDIQYCPIDASTHVVGACTQQTNAFTTARSYHSSVVYNGILYISGGYNGTYMNDIIYCPLNASGSVGTCTQQTSAYTTTRHGQSSVVYNGYMYLIGGNNSTNGDLDLIDRVFLGANLTGFGSAGTVTQQTSVLTNPRNSHASVVHSGYLYIIGGANAASTPGCDANSRCSDIQYCPINSDGSIGTCTQLLSRLTAPRTSHKAVVYNGYIYVSGGVGSASVGNCDSGGACNDVQYCHINTDGSVDVCQTAGTFNTGRFAHASAVANGRLYVMGGNSSAIGGVGDSCVTDWCSDIQSCPINTNGTIGTCVVNASTLPSMRSGFTAVVYNNFLYISGGHNGTSMVNTNHYCPINSDGSIGTCTSTSSFTTARQYHTAVAYNGFLYIMAGTGTASASGCDASGFCSDIQRCPINANGTVGTCTQQVGMLVAGRMNHASVVSGGYLYVVGGNSTGGTSGCSSGTCTDVQRFQTNAPSYASRYERTLDTSLGFTTLNSLVVNGTAACGFVLYYETAGSNGVYGATTKVYQESMGGTISLGNITMARYLRLRLVMKDSICGGKTQINDITLNYTAPPPDAPTLSAPANNSVANILLPLFQFRSSVPSGTYLRYKFDLCSTSDCSTIIRTVDQTAAQTGWSGQDQQTSSAYTGSTTLASSTVANHTYQAPSLSYGTQYWWRAYAIDPSGSNTWSSASSINTFYTNKTPDAPVLVEPASAQLSVGYLPILKLRSADQDSDYLRYKIDICTTSNCSSVLRTIDQTSSQTGWGSQSQQSGTAYSSSGTVGSSQTAVHTYQPTALSSNTQYWWRAYAIDPAGTNTWSSASSIGTFTTINPATSQTKSITGGTLIRGGTSIGN